ncbi:trigger factor [Acinetobacter radioresistens]|uniref:Trigger factor n=2 Tax=Acinetobacter radioresistens TaxID=40216 RepID=A0A2T1J3B0_ACIRA|nr:MULTISPECIES: trigger factor [Acinetobacter]EET80964.1 trigger factor [Acinetobacter radioresistens SK82]EJO36148.1 trigger factor [Acinetobacter radioresistens WC-A-157]ENV90972.1 trigger factor [Acinetobacter radioresistens DSM 6976 = NBRC 102413 = CIP 103788]EXB34727.1 trigger factor [Acinetobacter sp. 1461402]EXB73113.1 trigger factor [Acinetobacter sp. 230853]
MQVTSEAVSGVARRLNVSVPTSRINEQFEARLKRTAKTVKINGFRQGKVPVNVVRREYGAGIYQEVVNDIIRDTVFEAIQQEKINAVGMPNIDKVENKDDALVYEATVEVYPEVEVKALDTLTVERKTSEIQDKDVDQMIENLQKQRQTWVETKGMAKKDMQVTFDFEGTIDGEKFEGGSATDFKLVLGSGRMIPGFEDGIIGMKKGEEKVIDVTFPEDYQAENLAGKAAQFKITVKQVEKAKLPELDAEFLQTFGVSEEEGIDKLKADVRKNMEREVRNGLRNQVKQAAFDALVEANEVEVPSAMVAQEIDRQRQQMIQQFTQQFGGANAQTFDKSMLPDELFKEQAEKSVKLGVLVSKVLADAKLEVDPARVEAYIEDMASSYEDPTEVIEYFKNDKQQRAQIEAVVLEDQVVDYILAAAQVSDTEVSYEDLLKEQQARRA